MKLAFTVFIALALSLSHSSQAAPACVSPTIIDVQTQQLQMIQTVQSGEFSGPEECVAKMCDPAYAKCMSSSKKSCNPAQRGMCSVQYQVCVVTCQFL